MKFMNDSHKLFFLKTIQKSSSRDEYYKALFYVLGLTTETREYVDDLFDFKRGLIRTEGLKKSWQTGTTRKVTYLAFNLFNGGCPSVYELNDPKEKMAELEMYTVSTIFSCYLAPWFWEAVKIRFPFYIEEGA